MPNNVGQYLDVNVTVNTPTDPDEAARLIFVAEFWDGEVRVARPPLPTPAFRKRLNRGGTLTYYVQAVDPLGQASPRTAFTVDVNEPPVITGLTVSKNDLPLPYTSVLEAAATDAAAYVWLLNGEVVGVGSRLVVGVGGAVTGPPPDVTVSGPATLVLVVSDADGGAATATVELRTTSNQPPVVRVVLVTPQNLTIAAGATIQLSATAVDAEGAALVFNWLFWDGSTATGTTATNEDGSVSSTVTRDISRDTAGDKIVLLDVVDSNLAHTRLAATVRLIAAT